MKQAQFERLYRGNWQDLEEALQRKSGAGKNFDLPAAYRRLCNNLAVAKARRYSPALIEELNNLALQGHLALHRSSHGSWSAVGRYVTGGFARAVRTNWRYVAISSLAFFGSMIGMFTWVMLDAEIVFTVVDGGQLWQMEAMYSPDNPTFGRREDAGDVLMFGYYVRNNTSIGLQTLAGGLLAGLGTLFFLLFNGIFLGAIAGHLTRIGYGNETFFPFVSGHSATELMAIAIAGAAGLMIGHAIIAPGRWRRTEALRRAAARAMTLVWGVVLLFLIAATIEAFWSASAAPKGAKYAFGAAQWILLFSYLIFAGRRRESG